MKKTILIALLLANVSLISCNSKTQRSNNPVDTSNNQDDISPKGLQKKYLFLAKQTSTYKDAFIKVTKLQIDLDLVDKGNLDSDAVINEYNEVIGETYGYRSHVYEVRKNLKDKIDTAYLWRVQSDVAANLLLQYMAELKSQMK
jgi:thioredoxin-related protein